MPLHYVDIRNKIPQAVTKLIIVFNDVTTGSSLSTTCVVSIGTQVLVITVLTIKHTLPELNVSPKQ